MRGDQSPIALEARGLDTLRVRTDSSGKPRMLRAALSTVAVACCFVLCVGAPMAAARTASSAASSDDGSDSSGSSGSDSSGAFGIGGSGGGTATGSTGVPGGGAGRSDVRTVARCSRSATGELRLRQRDGTIEVRFAVSTRKSAGSWRVAMIHENRVAWRATRRVQSGDHRLDVRRQVPDLLGKDVITVYVWGPGGVSCRGSASLAA
jgi:hypothetical protein